MRPCLFDLATVKLRKLATNLRAIRPPKLEDRKAVPDELFDAAKEWGEDNVIMLYICDKYNMPPTDPRLLAYTQDQMLLEYIHDGIKEDRFILGSDGRPVRKVRYHGVEIYETGDKMWDDMEKEWADQDLSDLELPDGAITAEDEVVVDDENLLETIGVG